MNLKDLAKPFPAEDIEWRIGQSGAKGSRVWARVMAYISARAAMNRLDDVCGPGGWSVEYRPAPASQGFEPGFIARIGIKIGDEWVYKEDGAEQTDIESFKGGISGAFKRAAVLWGIGRYLYNLEAGFADVSSDEKPGYEWAKTKDGKEFYWAPPKLPGWALPPKAVGANAPPVNQAAPPKAQSQTVAQPKDDQPKPMNRAQLNAEIFRLAGQLRLSQKELADWVHDKFKKIPTQLSEREMETFLGELQFELGRQGESA